MRVLLAILGTALFVVAAVSGLRASGEADVLFVSSGSAEVGDETTITLGVAELAGPPVGAWTIDISYDRTVVTATECVALENSVCSPLFDEDTIRSTGASATGLFAPVDFARITFLCDEPGESRLTLSLSVWGDATGIGQLKVELQEGTITCTEPGQDGLIRIGSATAEVGEEVTVVLEAVDIPLPGLGTWTVDITYDTSVVSVVECNAQLGGVCNPAYGEDTLRVTGASAGGLSGTATLAEIVFACSRAGTTDLEVSLTFGRSFPVGEAPSFPSPISGRLTCTEPSSIPPAELPTTGVAERQPSSLPAAVPLAVLGAMLVAAAFAFRRYASRR